MIDYNQPQSDLLKILATDCLSIALKLLARDCLKIAEDHGWDIPTPEKWFDDNYVPAQLSLIHAEVSEALEAFRESDPDNFGEECADILIRLIQLYHGLFPENYLATEVVKKMEVNRQREFKHGGKRL